jgi:hypothetical protein
MNLEDKIESLVQRADRRIHQIRRRRKVVLYATGLLEKLKEVEFSLANLREFKDQANSKMTSTDIYSIDNKVHFYCDCFWAFLFASLDILGQIINQTNSIGLAEKDVYFKGIIRRIHTGTSLRNCLNTIIGSRTFRNLEKYRKCSLHRRHIFFEERTLRRSAGYTMSSTRRQEITVRYLCDDPLVNCPKVTQQREVTEYCEKTFEKIKELIGKCIDLLLT